MANGFIVLYQSLALVSILWAGISVMHSMCVAFRFYLPAFSVNGSGQVTRRAVDLHWEMSLLVVVYEDRARIHCALPQRCGICVEWKALGLVGTRVASALRAYPP